MMSKAPQAATQLPHAVWQLATDDRSLVVDRAVAALQSLGFFSSNVSIASTEARHVAVDIERAAYNDTQAWSKKDAPGSVGAAARQHYARRETGK